MMDLTEYWATLVSIVIGLGIADLLLNLLRLIHERGRVDWDGLPLMWMIVALGWIINYWWGVAANLDGSRDATVVGAFGLLLVQPILLFMMSASVLPRSMPAVGRLSMRIEWAELAPGLPCPFHHQPDRDLDQGHRRPPRSGLGCRLYHAHSHPRRVDRAVFS
ncbi:MAG: hypothetical protein QM773_21725 [Hyphomonadaceae bacterium]